MQTAATETFCEIHLIAVDEGISEELTTALVPSKVHQCVLIILLETAHNQWS